MCCLQEASWRGQGAWMPEMEGRRYKLWWSGKGDEVDGVGSMVKEELCEKVVDTRSVRDRVKTIVAVFEEDVLWLICGYAFKVDDAWRKNSLFMMSLNASGICILQMISLYAWVTLMDMLVGILMVLMACTDDMV